MNPKLDPSPHATVFARDGRVQVKDFLTPATAAQALAGAQSGTPWNVVFHDGERSRNYVAREYMALPVDERADVERQIVALARDGFGFLYLNHQLDNPTVRQRHPDVVVNAMLDLVRSDQVLDFVRGVTGEDRIVSATAQATCYAPGHFLTSHNDFDETAGRLVAYVINLSPRWRPDWGGVTLFYEEEDSSPVAGITPAGGALNLFRVPQWHSVSMVTPLAEAPRYSITGWFIDKPGA